MLQELKIQDISMIVDGDYRTINAVLKELLKDSYGFNRIKFNDNDLIIDVGANLGMVSIYLAKKYPNTKIISFEASPDNFKLLESNINHNNVTNIEAYNLAVSGDGENLYIVDGINGSGNKSTSKNIKTKHEVKSIKLDDIIKNNTIKLLKIDVEGAEFDILYNATKLSNVEYISAEFHGGYKNDKQLLTYLQKYIKKENIVVDRFFIRDAFITPIVFFLNRIIAKIKNIF